MHHNVTKINRFQVVGFILLIILVVGACIAMTSTSNAQVPPAAAASGSTLEQRVAQRKAERNVVIEQRDQQRLVSVCVAAQTKVRTLQQKTTPVVANRANVNRQIDAKLWIVIGKLKLAEKDTFQLEKQRAALAEKISVLQQTSQSYTQTLDDIVAVNCRADLIGFKALLDTARIYRTQLRDQSTDVRNYLINDIKPTLGVFATDLQPKPTTEGGN